MNEEPERPKKARVTLIGVLEPSYLARVLEECRENKYQNIELSMRLNKEGEYYVIFCAEDES